MGWISKPPPGTPLDRQHPHNAGCIAYWPFWDGAGELVADVIGGNHGRFTSVTPSATNGWTGGRAGGHAYRNDGVSSTTTNYITISERVPGSLNMTGAMSVCCWVRSHANRDQFDNIFNRAQSSGTFRLWTRGSGAAAAFYFENGAGNQILAGNSADRWQFVAFTHDGTTARTYLDGVLQNSDAAFGMPTWPSSAGAFLCFQGGFGRQWPAILDGLRLYNRALSPDEVRSLHDEPFAGFVSRGARRLYVAGGASVTSTASLEAAVQRALSAGASLDAAVQATRSAGVGADAAIQAAASATSVLDAAVRRAVSLQAAIDAAVQWPVSAASSLDAAVQRAVNVGASIDGAVQRDLAASVGIDAVVQPGLSVILALDAAIQVAAAATAALDAAVQRAMTALVSLDAAVQRQGLAAAGIDVAVLRALGLGAAIDAYVQVAGSMPAPPKRFTVPPGRGPFQVPAQPKFTVH